MHFIFKQMQALALVTFTACFLAFKVLTKKVDLLGIKPKEAVLQLVQGEGRTHALASS